MVEPPTKEGFEALVGLRPDLAAARELENPLRISRRSGSPVLSLPPSALASLFYETLDEESFADRVEEELDITRGPADLAENGSLLVHTGFRHVAKLWD